ncbi:hypothetical protein [Shewanella khirikhana]|uniref:Uncharacterized protein n=1 Tax=Shewanella khirikhana TaxID=1965282 RepID=A0ABN5TUF4_9GAMM|nr:hypothetical protein [Shewanella khirikhana]AZQ10150.1 hypothetical protein STH12_01014 [Shewanella khirikhana]
MAKKVLCNITIKGHEKTWGFHTYVDPKYLDEWRADGIQIETIVCMVPVSVQRAGFTKLWCVGLDVVSFAFLKPSWWRERGGELKAAVANWWSNR